MMDEDHLQDQISECMRILDESVRILADIEHDMDEDAEGELAADVGLQDLVEMGERVAEDARIKKAERDLIVRLRAGPE